LIEDIGDEGLGDGSDTGCVALRSMTRFSPPVRFSNILVKRAAGDIRGSNDKSLAALILIIMFSSDVV
jgi:hypothetical protein